MFYYEQNRCLIVNDDARTGPPSTSTIYVGVSCGSCQAIFTVVLDMKRVADLDLLKKVITGDESWVYGYDIETKDQYSQWKAFCND